jgi:hypothetical protein
MLECLEAQYGANAAQGAAASTERIERSKQAVGALILFQEHSGTIAKGALPYSVRHEQKGLIDDALMDRIGDRGPV